MISTGALGVLGFTVATHYAEAGRLSVLNQLRQLGTNILVVTPRRTASVRGRVESAVTTLVARDYTAIRRDVPGIIGSSAVVTGVFPVKAGDLTKNNCAVAGVEIDFPRVRSWPLQSGEFFTRAQSRSAARVAILGASVARDLFEDRTPIGARLFINRVPFQVIGVFSERGQDLDAGSEDGAVYVPLTTASRRLMNIDYYSYLVLSIGDWNRLEEVAASVREIVLKHHPPRGSAPEDFRIRTQKALIEAQAAASRRLERFVAAVALGGVALTGLGVLALSWMSVAARVVEIGTRRALGASEADIFWQFLLEALLISVLTNVLGVLVGWVGLRVLTSVQSVPLTFDWRGVLALCAFATSLNAAFAIQPARRAARLDPIRALRSS